jgi:hypothetical protein
VSLFLEEPGRGGKEYDVDRIVSFPHPFSYLKNEYICEYGCCQIRMRSGCCSHTDVNGIFSPFEKIRISDLKYLHGDAIEEY